MLSQLKWVRTGLVALMVVALLSGVALAKKPPKDPPPEPDPPPVIYDLTLFGGTEYISVSAMSEAGEVVGYGSNGGVESAFVYTSDWGMVDLNAMLPEKFSGHLERAYDINDNGQIIGKVVIDGEDDNFVLTLPAEADGVAVVTLLGNLHTDDRWLKAKSINDAGEVVGHGSDVNSERFAWYYHELIGLQPLMADYWGIDISVETINNNGVILGGYLSPFAIFWVVPGMDPEFFYGDGANAWEDSDMNDSGVFVGFRGVEVPVNKKKTRYTTRAYRHDGTDLIDIAGDDSNAYAINNNGDVVGVSATLGNFVYYDSLGEAFAFRDAVVGDADDMLIWDDLYGGRRPSDINDTGQICGTVAGSDGQPFAGYILTPITPYPPSPPEQ